MINIGKLLEATSYRTYNELEGLDAVVASTSPSHEMDKQRAKSAVKAIKELYGSIQTFEKYGGLWIAAGWLGQNSDGTDIPYEKSQRKTIVDTLESGGVNRNKIIQIDGRDTVDKTRELLEIPEIKDGRVKYIGISSYPGHIARFVLALVYAKQEGLSHQGTEFIGIPNPYQGLFYSKDGRLGDGIYGMLALIKDSARLEKHGFSGSVPGQNSEFYDRIKGMNSKD